ncbi:hypothetical protein GCM10017750_68070 [Streptomyces racemochromogenes]
MLGSASKSKVRNDVSGRWAARGSWPCPWAWATHNRTAVSVRSKSLTTSGTDLSPRRHNSTISALNSGVNCRRGLRGFLFAMLSIMDIRSRAHAQISGCPPNRNNLTGPRQRHMSE